MKRLLSTFIAASSYMLTSIAQAGIIEVDYFSLSGNVLIEFGSLAGGNIQTNYDNVIDLNGASFGERFDGQTLALGAFHDFDQLVGAPSGPLALLAGASGQNLHSTTDTSGETFLGGLGRLGFPEFRALGEGAVSILFDQDQSEFGFFLRGGNMGSPGEATIDFWGRDGSLLGSINPMIRFTGFYGYASTSSDIAGISIWNTDIGGIGFDKIIFDVPGESQVSTPATPAVILLGLTALGWSRRKQNGKRARRKQGNDQHIC